MAQVIEPGTRVCVISADGKTNLGLGTYIGREPTPPDVQSAWKDALDADSEVDVSTSPLIKLDSGNLIRGYECWWMVDGELPAT